MEKYIKSKNNDEKISGIFDLLRTLENADPNKYFTIDDDWINHHFGFQHPEKSNSYYSSPKNSLTGTLLTFLFHDDFVFSEENEEDFERIDYSVTKFLNNEIYSLTNENTRIYTGGKFKVPVEIYKGEKETIKTPYGTDVNIVKST